MGWAETLIEAESKLNQILLRKTYRRYGHLEKPRIADFPIYERDPRKALLTYLDGAWHRIADAQHFGARDEKAYGLANQVAMQGGDAGTVREMLDLTFGKKIHSQAWGQVERASGALQIITKFTPMTALANATQRLEPLAWVGPKMWGKHILKTVFGYRVTERDKDWALRCGELLDSSRGQMLREIGSENELVRRYLKMIRFSPEEDLDRIFTLTLGRDTVKDLFARFQKNPKNKAVERALRRFEVDIERAMANGKLSHQDLVNASQYLNDNTQYPYRVEELPEAFNTHPAAKIVLRWKSFAYFATKYKLRLGKEAFKEMKHGNFSFVIAMFLAFGIGYQFIGEAMNDLWAFIGRRPRDEKGFSRLFANYLWMGGYATDLLSATRYGKAGIYSYILGPDLSTYGNLIYAISSLWKERKTMEGAEEIKARVSPLGKFLFREVPVVGPALKGLFFPPEKPKEKGILEQMQIKPPKVTPPKVTPL